MTHIRLKLATAVAVLGMVAGAPAAWAECTITLGAAVSLTGKYSTNGTHTKNGYDLAVKLINGKGGVKVGNETCKLAVKYYDDDPPRRVARSWPNG